MGEDCAATRGGVGTEPGGVASGRARDTAEVLVGLRGVCLGRSNGRVQLALAGGRAADKGSALGDSADGLVAAGDSQVANDGGGVGGLLVGVDDADVVVVADNVEGGVTLEVKGAGSGGGEVVSLRHCRRKLR